MKHSNLFWGGLFVILGGLFILKNLDIVYFDWMSIFSLWPMLLVLVGVTMLPIKNGIKTILTLAVLAVTVALIMTNTRSWHLDYDIRLGSKGLWDTEEYDDRDWKEKSEHYFNEPYDSSIEEATINIEAVAGDFLIRDDSEYLMEFDQKGNIGPYIFSTNKKGDHQNLALDIKKKHYRARGLMNDVKISLNEKPLWNFYINTGAASVDLDLTKFKTRLIDIDGGASSVDIRIGEEYKKTKVNIDSGVSSIKILVPEDSGCEINTDTFLASRRFDGFEKIDKGLYQTNNFSDAKNKIYINIDAAITSLEVIRY